MVSNFDGPMMVAITGFFFIQISVIWLKLNKRKKFKLIFSKHATIL